MAIIDMQKITLIGLIRDKKNILDLLMKKGVVQIEHINEEDEQLKDNLAYRDESYDEVNTLEALLEKTSEAIKLLSLYDKRKKSLFSAKKDIFIEDFNSIINDKDNIIGIIEKVMNLDRELTATKGLKNRLINTTNSLEPWKSMDISFEENSTKHTVVLRGVLPAISSIANIRNELYSVFPQSYFEEVSSDREQSYCYIICHKNDEDEVQKIFKKYGFNRVHFKDMKGTIKSNLDELRREIESTERKINEIEYQIAGFFGSLEHIEILHDFYLMQKNREESIEKIIRSERAFLIKGWIPNPVSEIIKKELEDSFNCYMEIKRPEAGEEYPVLLKNNPIAESVETITEMYSVPYSGEVDPNAVMAPFFIMFFGLMLSDAGYGIVLAIGAAFVLLKFKPNRGTAKFIRLMFFCGLSTIFWGALFGGWFGNVVSVLSGGKMNLGHLWFNPMDDPEKLLKWSLAFGVFHIYVGITVRAYNFIKKKEYLDALFDSFFWYVFFTGAVLTVLPYVPDVQAALAAKFTQAGTYMFLAGGILLILTQGRKQKNVIMKLLSGITSLYDLVGFMSDVLSYSRLLALGLATSVIATIINEMGAMAGTDNVFGLLVFIIVFIAGHTFNFLINALGAYVHSSRLQYIEFFGKFYKGGGKAFTPFTINTKYINLKNIKE